MRTYVRLTAAALAIATLSACTNPASDDDARFGAPTQEWEFSDEDVSEPETTEAPTTDDPTSTPAPEHPSAPEIAPPPEPQPQPAPEPAPSPSTDPTPAPAPVPEPSSATDTEPAHGSRLNSAGSDLSVVFTLDDGEVEVWPNPATWDANSIVAAENMFNDPPAPGMVHVLLPITVSYSGSGSVDPYYDITVTFLADDGRSYVTGYEVVPDDLLDVNELYDGGSATGNLQFELPADQTPGGLWGISYGWDEPFWFVAT